MKRKIDIESILKMLPEERVIKRIQPSDILLFEPIAFLIPFILIFIAIEYYYADRNISLILLIFSFLSFVGYLWIYKNMEYIITDQRIISHVKVLNRIRSMPIKFIDEVFMKVNFIGSGSRTIVLRDDKGHEFQLRAVKEWKDVVELIYRIKYGNDVVISFQ